MRRRHFSLPLLALVIAAGCGGSDDSNSGSSGSGSGSGSEATASTGVDISWAARSRDVAGSAAALSARVTFTTGAPVQTSTFVVNRRSDPAAYTSTYGTPSRLRLGGVTLRVDFYAGSDASGALVGTAETGAILKSDGTLSRADGRPLGTVTSVGTIATLTISTPVTVAIGGTTTLVTTVRDAAGGVIAISPGSVTYSSFGPYFTVTPAGVVTGQSLGSGSVTANVDGISASATINVVRAANSAIVELDQPISGIVYSPTRDRVFVTVPANGANANRLLGLIPSSGAIDQSIQIGSNPGPVALSSDGNLLYVGLTGASTVQRVDLRTNAVGTPISLGQRFASDLAVSPTDSSVLAVSSESSSGYRAAVSLYRNGVLGTNVAENYSGGVLAFNTNGTELYGYNNQDSGFNLFRYTADANGVTLTQDAREVFQGYRTRIVFSEGRLYGGDGRVVDASTLNRLGTFPLAVSYGEPFALDATARRIYFYEEGSNGTGQIRIFNIDTFALVETKDLPGVVSSPSNARTSLTLIGTNRIALALPNGKLYLLDLARL